MKKTIVIILILVTLLIAIVYADFEVEGDLEVMGDLIITSDQSGGPIWAMGSDIIATTGYLTIEAEVMWLDGEICHVPDLRPIADNAYALGGSTKRWNTIWCAENAYYGPTPREYGVSTQYGLNIGGGAIFGTVDANAVLDDLTIAGTFSGTGATDIDYKVEIDGEGTPDTFKWSDDGGSTWDATTVSITGSAQTLNNGVTITFDATTGHTSGDYWTWDMEIRNPIFLQDATGDGIMWVGNDGKVGINTESPATILDVNGTGTFNDISVSGALSAGAITGTSLTLNMTQDYLFTKRAGSLAIQSRTEGQPFGMELFTGSGDGTDALDFRLFAKGLPEGITDSEYLTIGYIGNLIPYNFLIHSDATGTGTVRPLILHTGTNTGQLTLAIDGDNTMSGALGVTGTVTGGSLVIDTDVLVVDAVNDRVGVGGSPSTALHVLGTGATDIIRADNGLDFNPVNKPSQATATAATGAGLEIGDYYYFSTFYTALGETNIRIFVAKATTTEGNQQVDITNLTISPDYRVVGRKIYRGDVNQQYHAHLLTTIADNTTTTYEDTTADGDLGATNYYYRSNTTTKYITSDGARALTVDENLTTLGYNAGVAITTGGRSTFLGSSAGKSFATGTDSTFVGHSCGGVAATGSGLTIIGTYAGNSQTAAVYGNTLIGSYAGMQNTGGSYSTVVGYTAMRGAAATATNYNTVMGYAAGYSMAGSSNVFLGNKAGYYETGSSKLFIDNAARASEADARVKALIYGVFDADPANQTLQVNAALGVTGAVTTGGDINIGSSGAGDRNLYVHSDTAGKFIRLKALGNYSGLEAATLLTITSTGYINIQSGTGQHQYFDCGGTFSFRDQDDSDAVKVTIASATGIINTVGNYQVDGVQVVTNQQAHITDADNSIAAAAGDPPTKAEFDALVTAYNDLATKFNTLLAYLDADAGHGLLAGAP